ncbi:MAG: hypothetical protein R3E79_31870 [Caldilineaceae bacterium]
MTIATLDYQTIRQAVLRLPQQQRLQLIKDAILTIPDESVFTPPFDFEATLQELQRAFAEAGPLPDQARDDARYDSLMEKHGP